MSGTGVRAGNWSSVDRFTGSPKEVSLARRYCAVEIHLITFIGHNLCMRYWWVNHKQTHRHEVDGGYLWSPKRKANGHRNPFYEFMREVAPGDRVFSFASASIRAIGSITSYAYEATKPTEFGPVGSNWANVGWRVDVQFTALDHVIRPARHMGRLGPLRSPRYSPLLEDGRGAQSVYLAELPKPFALALAELIGAQAQALLQSAQPVFAESLIAQQMRFAWDAQQVAEIETDRDLPETTRQAIIQARRGQGLFKQRVMAIEPHCRLTGVDRPEHLRASHCKPWRDANNQERLDGENGLLLTPNADHLFDGGFISFENNGRVLISPTIEVSLLQQMGLSSASLIKTRPFNSGQRVYLEYHRDIKFLRAQLKS